MYIYTSSNTYHVYAELAGRGLGKCICIHLCGRIHICNLSIDTAHVDKLVYVYNRQPFCIPGKSRIYIARFAHPVYTHHYISSLLWPVRQARSPLLVGVVQLDPKEHWQAAAPQMHRRASRHQARRSQASRSLGAHETSEALKIYIYIYICVIARVPPCPSSVTPGLLVPVPKFSGVSDCTGDPDRNIETSLDVYIYKYMHVYISICPGCLAAQLDKNIMEVCPHKSQN